MLVPLSQLYEFDLTESTLVALRWSDDLRDVCLTVDYYWSEANPTLPGDHPRTTLYLKEVRWIRFVQDEEFKLLPIDYGDFTMLSTIIGWSTSVTHCDDAPSKYSANPNLQWLAVELNTSLDHSQNWLEAACEEILVEGFYPNQLS